MANDELAGLSRDELLELVRRQQEALAEREAAIERRDEKIRELEGELAQLGRPPQAGAEARARRQQPGPERAGRGSRMPSARVCRLRPGAAAERGTADG